MCKNDMKLRAEVFYIHYHNPDTTQYITENREQAITWTIVVPVHWWVYAALGGEGVGMSRINSCFLENT